MLDFQIKPIAAIFDLDGLMLDTERPFLNGLKRKAAERGWDVPFELLLQTIGIDSRGTDKFLRGVLGEDFPFISLRDEVYDCLNEDAALNGIAHRPGLIPLLDALCEKKVPMAIATSTDRLRAVWKLENAGLASRFKTMVCGDEVKSGKPAPDIFLKAAEKLAVEPSLCAGFEDSPAGLKALSIAGIRSIFIKDMLEPVPEILAGVWKRCSSLDEAAALF